MNSARHVDLTPWSADDRQWFARRPHRAHRVRRKLAGETFTGDPKLDATAVDLLWVVVRQIREGVRIRIPCDFPESPCRDWLIKASRHEPGAHALFDLNERIHRGESSCLIECSTIAERIEFYTNVGSA